jgi:[Skp1-protein]-hydroxyproline N-acetylglucosaminyltransferase
MVPVPPDDDCFQLFCDTDLGKPICAREQVRVLNIDEPESLGPYAARYFASKLWYGEQWFMQTDAHMTFATHWDATSIAMLNKAPSEKPVLSHYPPGHMENLDQRSHKPTSRLCGPVFATSDLESQIIRLEGSGMFEHSQLEHPAFAPFTAAGYFVAHSEFLAEVPFDPFLPWIFMGEEIIMSSRLWTAGYDIFSPTQAVVGHIYVRRHKPKFWESVHRAFTPGVHNPLQAMVLDRIKYQLGYPEAAVDMLKSKSLLTAVEQYTMGTARPLSAYLRIVGLNMTTKECTRTGWCEGGYPPPGSEKHDDLYPAGKLKKELDKTRLFLDPGDMDLGFDE